MIRPPLYRGDLVTIRDRGTEGTAWVDELVTIGGRQAGAWVYLVQGGRILDRKRRYWPREAITWQGLCTVQAPSRTRRLLAALAEALGRAQLVDVPEALADVPEWGPPPGGLDPWGRDWCYCLDAPQVPHAHVPDYPEAYVYPTPP